MTMEENEGKIQHYMHTQTNIKTKKKVNKIHHRSRTHTHTHTPTKPGFVLQELQKPCL